MGHARLDTLEAYLDLNVDDLKQAHKEHGPVDSIL